jgi:hypothetical protein
MNNIGPTFIVVVGGIIGLAIIAVLVSQKAQTPAVLQAGGSAFATIIGAAVGPVTGGGGNQFGSGGGTSSYGIGGAGPSGIG